MTVANAARVSFHKEASNYTVEQNNKLIGYLAKNKHFSPFNHTFISLRIKAPIFVSRQLVKHRFMPWNEVSRRYVDEPPEFYIPFLWRARAENVKQGSSESEFIPVLGMRGFAEITPEEGANRLSLHALDIYNEMLEAGVAPEMARMVLPQNVHTEWMWSGTLGAWADMLRLRLDPHAQLESRIVAIKAREIISPLFPISLKSLLETE